MRNRLIKNLKGKDRLLLVVFVGIAILLVYFIASSHYLMLQRSKSHVLEKLKAISTTASLMINGDEHQYLSNTFLYKDDLTATNQDSIYQKIHSILKKIKDINGLNTQIYTMIYNKGSDEYEFITTSSEQPYYRHMFINYPMQLREQTEIGGVIDVYETENGTWLSAFAPIVNKDGEQVALLQADESFVSFINEANRTLIKNILVSLILFVPFSIFLYSYIKNALEKEHHNQQILEERNEEIELQNELIKKNNIQLESAKEVIEKRNENLDRLVKERTAELLLANHDLETFLYRSSHDIQGPIASLRGIYSLAQADKDNYFTYLEMMNKTVHQLDTRVKSINTIFELKQKDVVIEPFFLSKIIRLVIEDQALKMGCKDLNLVLDFDESFMIDSDKSIFEIAIRELTRNAIQYRNSTPLRITLDAFNTEQGKIQINFKDNGQGISDAEINRIFEMFHRGNEKSQGSGLGLYSIKSALQKVNATIRLAKNNKIGTCFEIILPTP